MGGYSKITSLKPLQETEWEPTSKDQNIDIFLELMFTESRCEEEKKDKNMQTGN